VRGAELFLPWGCPAASAVSGRTAVRSRARSVLVVLMEALLWTGMETH